MDDSSGNIAVDEAENINLTASGDVTWNTGVNGSGGLQFGGGNVDVNAGNILANSVDDFSISLWLKFPTGAVNPEWTFG